MADTYRIVRMYQSSFASNRTIKRGLSLQEAQAHCSDPESSSSTCTKAAGRLRTRKQGAWFDAYEKE